MPSNFECVSCGSDLAPIVIFDKYHSVTSDARPFPDSEKLFLCKNCLLVQRARTDKWTIDCNEIYVTYEAYRQGDKSEQKIFATDGNNMTRSKKILSYLTQKNIEVMDGTKWLDFGCGEGNFLWECGNAHEKINMHGFEVNDNNKASILGIKNCNKFFTDFNELENNYDFISLIHVLEHIPQPKDLLQGLASKLTPTGVLIVAVPNVEQNAFDLLVTDHGNFFSKYSLSKLIINASLNILHVESDYINKELLIIASVDKTNAIDVEPFRFNIQETLESHVGYLDGILNDAKQKSSHANISIFGTTTGATWLTAEIGLDKIDSYIDEDRTRIGSLFNGKPVIGLSSAAAIDQICIPLTPMQRENLLKRINN